MGTTVRITAAILRYLQTQSAGAYGPTSADPDHCMMTSRSSELLAFVLPGQVFTVTFVLKLQATCITCIMLHTRLKSVGPYHLMPGRCLHRAIV